MPIMIIQYYGLPCTDKYFNSVTKKDSELVMVIHFLLRQCDTLDYYVMELFTAVKGFIVLSSLARGVT
jgi:hypothetical protein